MLLRKEVTHATDLDLLTVHIGNRRKATKIFAKAKFSLVTLLHSQAAENGDLFCAEGSSAYGDDSLKKLQAAVDLAFPSIGAAPRVADSPPRSSAQPNRPL